MKGLNRTVRSATGLLLQEHLNPADHSLQTSEAEPQEAEEVSLRKVIQAIRLRGEGGGGWKECIAPSQIFLGEFPTLT